MNIYERLHTNSFLVEFRNFWVEKSTAQVVAKVYVVYTLDNHIQKILHKCMPH